MRKKQIEFDGEIIDKELHHAMGRKTGLTIITAPTGSGKSYNLELNIARFVDNYLKDPLHAQHRKMIVLMPSRNNLSNIEKIAQKLGDDVKSKDKIYRNVLLVQRNISSLMEGLRHNPNVENRINNLALQEEAKKFIADNIKTIREYIYWEDHKPDLDNSKKNGFYPSKEYLISLQANTEKAEQNLRLVLREELYRLDKQIKKAAKQHNWAAYDTYTKNKKKIEEWVNSFYVYSRINEYPVYIMTLDKFMRTQDPIISPMFTMCDPDYFKDTLIVIDESDSAYSRMSDIIIDEANRSSVNFIRLLERITSLYLHKTLPNDIEQAMKEAIRKDTSPLRWENMRKTGDAYARDFYLNRLYKTELSSTDNGFMPAIINDGTIYNLGSGKNYVQAAWNPKAKHVSIYLESDKYNPVVNKRDQINMVAFFQQGERIIERFSAFLTIVAEKMAKLNAERNKKNGANEIMADLMEAKDAMRYLMNALSMTKEDKEYFFALSTAKKSKSKKLNKQNISPSFFSNGYHLKIFEDNDAVHPYNTDIHSYHIRKTPESILLQMAQVANVVCLSATGLNRSINENFSIQFLRDNLGASFHTMSKKAIKGLQKFYLYRNQAYYEGRWKIGVKPLSSIKDTYPDGSLLSEAEAAELFKNKKIWSALQKYLIDTLHINSPTYTYNRYLNLLCAMYDFISNPTLYSMVALEKKKLFKETDKKSGQEKSNDLDYSFDIVLKMKRYICLDVGIDPEEIIIERTVAEDFDNIVPKIKKEWAAGEKAILFSTYATTSKGTNLQYDIPDNPAIRKNLVTLAPELESILGAGKYQKKDIDALYLGQFTYLTASYTEGSKDLSTRTKEFLKIVSETEKLLAESQISNNLAKRRLIEAHKQMYNDSENISYINNSLYNTEGIQNVVNKNIKQSVGRMDRVNVKNRETRIYIARENLAHMDPVELAETEAELIPGMKEIMKCIAPVTDKMLENREKAKILRLASKQHTKSCRHFHYLLNLIRTEAKGRQENIHIYNCLRWLVLKHPTITEEERETLDDTQKELVEMYYIDTHTNDVTSYDFKVITGQSDDDMDNRKIDVTGFNGGANDKVQSSNTVLSRVLMVDGVKELFTRNGYATDWKKGRYIITPKGLDIYNGILGEVVEEMILSRILKSIQGDKQLYIEEMAPEVFEKFDFKIGHLYIDAKNWRIGVRHLNELKFKHHVEDKRAECDNFYHIQGIAVILNLYPENESITNDTINKKDATYIEIPRLLESNGQISMKAYDMLAKLLRRTVYTYGNPNK